MSARSGIVKALVEKFKEIDGTGTFGSNLYKNVIPRIKFWDEVNDFPFVCVQAGHETREYLPGNFKWAFLTITIKIYVQDELPVERLEVIIGDIESVLDANNRLEYATGKNTEEINITAIDTDEGVLAPLGVADITIQVRYPL